MGDISLETVAKQVADLAALVQAHKNDQATLDKDALEGIVKGIMAQATIVRKGEPQVGDEYVVDPTGQIVRDPIIKGGKYDGRRASELQFVAGFLTRAHAYSPGSVKMPSEALTKALTATGAATGDELVPTGMAAQLWNDFFTASRVVSQFAPNIAMPTDPFDIPLELGDVTWRKGTQNTGTTASDTATRKSTLTATELVAEVDWSYSLDEDAVIAMLPSLQARLRMSGAEVMDGFALNADATAGATGNINLDDDTPVAQYWLSSGQDGLRHQGIVDNTDCWGSAAAAMDDTKWLTALGTLDKYGVDPSRLVCFCGIKTYLHLLSLANVRTLDKYGNAATVITGELAKYAGVPIVPSASMPLTEADGKVSVTPANNTKGQLVIAHRDMWKIGFRRQLLMEVDRDIQKRMFILVCSFRTAIAAFGTRSTATIATVVGNISV